MNDPSFCFPRRVQLPLLSIFVGFAAMVLPTSSARADESRVLPRHDDTTGVIRVEFRKAGGERRDEVTLLPAVVDGKAQTNFRKSAGEPVRIENSLLRVEIESIGPASAAVIWSAIDGAPHDFEIAIEDNSAYYGGGERFSSLNHKGHILPMVSIDRPGDKGVVTYKPVPFYMSTRGYAAWLDSFAPGSFDFNASHRDRVILRYRAARLRLVLIDGPGMGAMITEFTHLTGRPRVPPAWSFAPWKSRNVHNNREEVLADAELTRKHDLPGSVIVLDSPWETGYNDFRLNDKQFREPEALFGRLRELGFYTCLWLTPMINVENQIDMQGIDEGPSRNYAEAVKLGYLVKQPDGKPMIVDWWKGRGGLVDFTNPAAVGWWHEQIDQSRKWGLHALKCDDGEGNFVQDAVFHDGTSATEMKNRYAALYLKSAQEYLDQKLDGDGVLFARCGFTGTQAQPFCWAGDNEANFSFENGLPTVILAGQNAALSGISFWGHDIAGYIGTQTKELFIRWTQFGALSPLMQVHMQSNTGAWDFDEQTLSIYRKFAKLHTSLFPYLYDAAHETARSGMPIIRPMALAFPNDFEAAGHRYQYLFGPDLLVAPMYQPGTHRSVYLPKTPDGAAWIDYWSGEEYKGGQLIEADAPLERMPLYVRGGAILCLLPDDVDTLVPRYKDMAADVVTMDERRILQVWPDKAGTLTSYDGLSAITFTKGEKQSLRLSAKSERQVEVQIMFAESLRGWLDSDKNWAFDPATKTFTRTVKISTGTMEFGWRIR